MAVYTVTLCDWEWTEFVGGNCVYPMSPWYNKLNASQLYALHLLSAQVFCVYKFGGKTRGYVNEIKSEWHFLQEKQNLSTVTFTPFYQTTFFPLTTAP